MFLEYGIPKIWNYGHFREGHPVRRILYNGQFGVGHHVLKILNNICIFSLHNVNNVSLFYNVSMSKLYQFHYIISLKMIIALFKFYFQKFVMHKIIGTLATIA